MAGMLVEGMGEIHTISEPDTRKDSSANVTLVARALDVVQEKFAKLGKQMPKHFALLVRSSGKLRSEVFGGRAERLRRYVFLVSRKSQHHTPCQG